MVLVPSPTVHLELSVVKSKMCVCVCVLNPHQQTPETVAVHGTRKASGVKKQN